VQKSIKGPVEANYEMNEAVEVISWSTCGDHTAILNVNSEIRIAPQSSKEKGMMTVNCTPLLSPLSGVVLS
jgi:hypothetical protein